MSNEIFTSILAALVVARLVEPGVDLLRNKLWGYPRSAAMKGAGATSCSGSLQSRR